MELDAQVHSLELELKQLKENLAQCVSSRNFTEAAKLQAEIKSKEPEFEARKQELLDKRATDVEDIIVIDMKEGWKPLGALQNADLSYKFQKENGHYSVQMAIDKTKNGTTNTPDVFYVLSSTTSTYHKLEVKYKSALPNSPYVFDSVDEGNSNLEIDIKAMEEALAQIDAEIKEAVARRDFVTAGAKQQERKDKETELEVLKQQLLSQPTPQPSGRRQELEAAIEQLSKEIKEAAAQRDFVAAGQKQKQKKDLQEELESLANSEPDQASARRAELEEEIRRIGDEIKDAVAQRDFVTAGQKQKQKQDLEEELANLEEPEDDNSSYRRELEADIYQLEAEIKEAVGKRDFVTAGRKQQERKDKQEELARLGGGSMADMESDNAETIRQLEEDLDQLDAEIQEAVGNRDFVTAGQKQKERKEKAAELAELK